MTIAAYEVLTCRKQRIRRREDDVELDVVDAQPLAAQQLIERDLYDNAHAIIGEMSERDRQALASLLLGETPRGETERKRRFRAVERLRAAGRKAHG